MDSKGVNTVNTSVRVTPTITQIQAGVSKGRAALVAYSSFDSSMVSDDALKTFVIEIATAVLNSK